MTEPLIDRTPSRWWRPQPKETTGAPAVLSPRTPGTAKPAKRLKYVVFIIARKNWNNGQVWKPARHVDIHVKAATEDEAKTIALERAAKMNFVEGSVKVTRVRLA